MMPSSTTLLWRACTQVVLRGGVDSTNRIVTGSTNRHPLDRWDSMLPPQTNVQAPAWAGSIYTAGEMPTIWQNNPWFHHAFRIAFWQGFLEHLGLRWGSVKGSVPVISCHGFGEFQATTSIQQRERQKVGLRFASCETAPLLRYTSFQWKRLKLRFAWWKLCLQAPHASVQRTWWGSDFFPRLGCCSIKDVSSVTPPFCWFYAQWILMGYDFPFDAIPWNLKPVVFFTLQADLVRKICDNLACKPLEASWPDHRW